MNIYKFGLAIVFLICTMPIQAQQITDINYKAPYFKPAYEANKGPLILIDEAHNNFHTASGRYSAFADLLRSDGYVIKENKQVFGPAVLKNTKILVIANALHLDNINLWNLPTPSAFTNEEINFINSWVKSGGSLFLIADHMPFAGAASDLAMSFGFKFYNGFAIDKVTSGNFDLFTRANGTLLSNDLSNAQVSETNIDSIVTFTGQGFDIPVEAKSILNFSKGFKILLPDQAWKFDDKTTKIEAEGKSQGAYMNYGKGKIVVFGEAAMFTAQLSGGKKVGMNSSNAKNNYLLLLSIARWLSE